jgi:hypothetical protein
MGDMEDEKVVNYLAGVEEEKIEADPASNEVYVWGDDSRG